MAVQIQYPNGDLQWFAGELYKDRGGFTIGTKTVNRDFAYDHKIISQAPDSTINCWSRRREWAPDGNRIVDTDNCWWVIEFYNRSSRQWEQYGLMQFMTESKAVAYIPVYCKDMHPQTDFRAVPEDPHKHRSAR